MSKQYVKSSPTLSISMLLALFPLVGCSSFGTPPVEDKPIRFPPSEAMVKQPDHLEPPVSGLIGDVLLSTISYANSYHECRRLHSWLVDWINDGLSAPPDNK